MQDEFEVVWDGTHQGQNHDLLATGFKGQGLPTPHSPTGLERRRAERKIGPQGQWSEKDRSKYRQMKHAG